MFKAARNLAILGVALGATVLANASPITATFGATNNHGDVLSGYFTVDGAALAADLASSSASTLPIQFLYLTFDGTVYDNGPGVSGVDYVSFPVPPVTPSNPVYFFFPQGNLYYVNPALCFSTTGCTEAGPLNGYPGTVSLKTNANPTTGVTPEPGTLTLLGTGMLGLYGIARRKLSA